MAAPFILELDFGMGNIRSLQKAFEHLGAPVVVDDTPEQILKADALLLPGDGAFGEAMNQLREREMIEPIQQHVAAGKPLLGVCIGFQVLFHSSNEFGNHTGLNFFQEKVTRFPEKVKPVPHMGWAPVQSDGKSRLLHGIENSSWFYFVHSYRVQSCPYETAVAEYPDRFTAVVEKDNLFATQFHPEKSQKPGLTLLRNFLECI